MSIASPFQACLIALYIPARAFEDLCVATAGRQDCTEAVWREQQRPPSPCDLVTHSVWLRIAWHPLHLAKPMNLRAKLVGAGEPQGVCLVCGALGGDSISPGPHTGVGRGWLGQKECGWMGGFTPAAVCTVNVFPCTARDWWTVPVSASPVCWGRSDFTLEHPMRAAVAWKPGPHVTLVLPYCPILP